MQAKLGSLITFGTALMGGTRASPTKPEAAHGLKFAVFSTVLLTCRPKHTDPYSADEMLQRAATIATGPAAFQSSSDAVFRWAPIADELKCDDEEIVRNSIHLRWIGVRRDLKEVFRHTAIADDWHHQKLSI